MGSNDVDREALAAAIWPEAFDLRGVRDVDGEPMTQEAQAQARATADRVLAFLAARGDGTEADQYGPGAETREHRMLRLAAAEVDPTPLERTAATFTTPDEVNRLSVLLMRAWAAADPRTMVAQHPASFVATFADLARAVLAARGDAAPTEVEWGVRDDDGVETHYGSGTTAEVAARRILAIADGFTLIQRTVSAWRGVN